ncbi:MAG: hypothetical protein RTU92_08215 [Candidatus Thorarchaeota archaeon]
MEQSDKGPEAEETQEDDNDLSHLTKKELIDRIVISSLETMTADELKKLSKRELEILYESI